MINNEAYEIMLNTLEQRYHEVDGIERESIVFKIENIKRHMKMGQNNGNIYTSRIVSTDKIKAKMMVNENLVKGYKKLMENDKSLESKLKPLCDLISRKDMLLEREFSLGEIKGEKFEFNKISGTIIFNFLDIQCDPIFELKKIDFYIDSKYKATKDINSEAHLSIELEENSEIEIVMVGKNDVLIGLVYLPCDFFIDKDNNIITFDFRYFNTFMARVEFKKEIKLIRKNAEIRCIYKEGHGLEKLYCIYPIYCEICHQMLPLFTNSLRCFRCKFTCHKNCLDYTLFQCKNSKNIKKEEFKKRYDIQHFFEEKVPSGFRYCFHCGNRIQKKEGMCYKCIECHQRYHKDCKNMAFNSCGIDLELRKKMAEYNPAPPGLKVSATNVNINDFKLLRVLGRGNFGKIILVKYKNEDQLLALKILRKEKISNTNDVFYIELERRILNSISKFDHPFVINLKFCFQNSQNLFFVTEYISGGDLFHHVVKQPFSSAQIKIYAAELLLGLQFLHKQKIIYRDLKLDNLMLTADGHLKIIDFGLSKDNMGPLDTTYTYCGTPDTIAPEIIKGDGYTKDVDWWSYGIVLYELYEKTPPFSGVTNTELARSIIEKEPLFITISNVDIIDIIKKLLNKNPNKRLGHGEADAEEIKKHRYFADIDWKQIYNKEIKPEFIPGDNSLNFDSYYNEEEPIISPAASMDELDHYFINF